MSIFIPNENHIHILNEIGKWKVLSLGNLYSEIGNNVDYSSFCKTIKKIEKEGLISSFHGYRCKKYLSLTGEGGKLSKYASPYLENKIELKHDLIAGHVLKKFLEFENFKSGHISYEDLSANPDAVIYAVRNNREYSLGIEVELHQKSQRRVIKKFSKYYDSQIFNYIIYVMPKEAIFHSYQKIILGMSEKIQGKIILLLDKKLTQDHFNYLESEIFFRQKTKSFGEVFA